MNIMRHKTAKFIMQFLENDATQTSEISKYQLIS